jgi:hypothetical protein
MLDNMVKELVEYRRMCQMYELKTNKLQELNLELTNEASKLQDHFIPKQEDLECSISNDQDSRGDADERLIDIKHIESNIDHISREIELINTDLDDLSRRIDTAESNSAKTFTKIGRDVISSYSLQQSQTLLYDTLCEKAEVLEALYLAEDDKKNAEIYKEELIQKIEELQEQMIESKKTFQQKLDEAEKLRVNDVWTIMKSKSNENSINSNSSSSDLEINISLLRAQELENEIELMSKREEELVFELDQKNNLIKTQEEDILKLNLILKTVSDHTTDQPNATSNSSCYDSLKEIWDKTGVSSEYKQIIVENILNAAEAAKINAVLDAENVLKTKSEEVRLAIHLRSIL